MTDDLTDYTNFAGAAGVLDPGVLQVLRNPPAGKCLHRNKKEVVAQWGWQTHCSDCGRCLEASGMPPGRKFLVSEL